MVSNALCAAAIGEFLGMTDKQIETGVKSYKTVGSRSNVIRKNDITIIDDCYNANPVSMAAALDVLSHATGRTIAVLGDMGELGENEKALHYGVGVCVGEKKIHTLFCAGELAAE